MYVGKSKGGKKNFIMEKEKVWENVIFKVNEYI